MSVSDGKEGEEDTSSSSMGADFPIIDASKKSFDDCGNGHVVSSHLTDVVIGSMWGELEWAVGV